MIVRWIFRTVFAWVITRLLGKFFPMLRHVLRLLRR
jgi:hypothetical protein